jgi:hypothetical protein
MTRFLMIALSIFLLGCSEKEVNKVKESLNSSSEKSKQSMFSCSDPENFKILTNFLQDNIVKMSSNKDFELGVKVDTVSTLSTDPFTRCEASVTYSYPGDLKSNNTENLLVIFNLKKNEIKEGEVYVTVEPVDISKLVSMQTSVLTLREEIASNIQKSICVNLINEVKNLNIKERRDSLGTAQNMLRSRQFNEYQSSKFNPRFDSDVWYEKNGNPPFTHRRDYYQNNLLRVEIYSMYSDGTSRRGDFVYPVGYHVESVRYFGKDNPIKITGGLIGGYSCDFNGKMYSFSS